MNYDTKQLEQEFEATKDWLKKEYTQISTGRANPSLLDSVMIDSYGSQQPIKNVAAMTVEEARTLRIVPWDKSHVDLIQKAIVASGLPFSVAVDGEGLRASIPQLTAENKVTITKLAKEKLEQARITVRGEREKAHKTIDGEELSDDQKKDAKEDVQKLVDTTNKELEEIFKAKESDITNV